MPDSKPNEKSFFITGSDLDSVKKLAKDLSYVNEQLTSVIQPIHEYKNVYFQYVAPIQSAGSHVSQLAKDLENSVVPNKAKLWDLFASGSALIRPPVESWALKPESLSKYAELAKLQIPEVKKEASELADKTLAEMNADDLSARVLDYHESLANAETVSTSLKQIVEQSIVEEDDSKVGGWFDSAKNALDNIGERIGETMAGTVKSAVESATKALSAVRTAIGKGADVVKKAIKELCTGVQELFLRIVGAIFDFIRRLQKVAIEKGFFLKEVALEISGAGIKLETIAGVPIPIPRIDPPKITMTFAPPGRFEPMKS